MKSMRNEIKHITRVVTILTAICAMTFVWAGSASAVVIGPVGNPTVIQTPVQSIVRPPIGLPPAEIGLTPVGTQVFVRPPVFNPFFRPAFFNPFFRPAFFNPFFNPFFGADVDVGVGLGIGAVD